MENNLERLEEVAEKMQQAAGTMIASAHRLHSAIDRQDSSLTAVMLFMDNWITRLEAVQERFQENGVRPSQTGV